MQRGGILFDANDRDIPFGVDGRKANHRRFIPIFKLDFRRIGPFDHVIVGHDAPIGINDKTTPNTRPLIALDDDANHGFFDPLHQIFHVHFDTRFIGDRNWLRRCYAGCIIGWCGGILRRNGCCRGWVWHITGNLLTGQSHRRLHPRATQTGCRQTGCRTWNRGTWARRTWCKTWIPGGGDRLCYGGLLCSGRCHRECGGLVSATIHHEEPDRQHDHSPRTGSEAN